MELPGAQRATPGRYLLRGLLRCGPCDELLVPSFSSHGHRYYGCPQRRCPRPWVPAERTEQAVWARVAARLGVTARDTPVEQRPTLLRAVLAEVRVGPRVADLEYRWR